MGQPHDASIPPGQPFTLTLLESLRAHGKLCDAALVPALKAGVSTGVLEPLVPSGRWNPVSAEPALGPSLVWCEGNWKSASVDPTSLQALVDQEVADGFVARWDGDEASARTHWPKGVAKGKLGVARAAGRDDRRLLDTTVSGVSPPACIPERSLGARAIRCPPPRSGTS